VRLEGLGQLKYPMISSGFEAYLQACSIVIMGGLLRMQLGKCMHELWSSHDSEY
jgi:hypothetical protein